MIQRKLYREAYDMLLRPTPEKAARLEIVLQRGRIADTQREIADANATIDHYSKALEQAIKQREKLTRRLYRQRYILRKLEKAQEVDDAEFLLNNITA